MAVALISVIGSSGCDILVQSQEGSQITMQRNELAERAIAQEDVTHLFWVDSDIVLPQTALRELLEHNLPIVGATYCKKRPPHDLLGHLREAEGRLKPADYLPGGCMLVQAQVYRDAPWPWYHERVYLGSRVITSEDYSFCERVRENGYDIWCDLDLSHRIKHLGTQEVQFRSQE